MAGIHLWIADEDLGVFNEQHFTLFDAWDVLAASGGRDKGLSVTEFVAGIQRMEPLAIQTLVWFLRKRKGQTVDRASINFNFGDLRVEEEADPTMASSGTPDAGISDSSPTTAI